ADSSASGAEREARHAAAKTAAAAERAAERHEAARRHLEELPD
ncbi:MAG: hypothetical protein JWN54_100, partial [Mycobacterium sp.]|nr:hypothetical protein [Mycobacterium sp.]